jgi:hypothetical protein
MVSPNDILVSRSRLQLPPLTASNIHIVIYIKCLSTIICCGWAYGCTLTLLYLWRWGPNIVKLGYREPNEVVVSWLRLQTPTDCILHKYWRYIWHLSTFICCEWAYGCTLTQVYLVEVDIKFSEIGLWGAQVMAQAARHQWLHPASILDTSKFVKCLSTFICCEWAYGCTLTLLYL